MGRHWLVTVTGVTLKHYIQVLQSSYNLCATSAIVTNFHNSDINDRDVFQMQLLQSVAISQRTENKSYDEDHGHDGVFAWMVLPPW